ncbi:MAG: hypothetical protein WDA60_17980 [Acidimicrobiia bacterium]
MSTQLRLITKSEPANRPLRGRATPRRDRRPVHWQGQWRLDDHTREIGKAGVASARAALERAHPDATPDAEGLRQAS